MISDDDKEIGDNLIESFNVEGIEKSELKLYNNPINLKIYDKINGDNSKIEGTLIENIGQINMFPIISSIIVSFIFYLVVITTILTHSILLTVFAVLLYINGTFFVQTGLIPVGDDYLENTEQMFEDDLKKILNCHTEYYFRYYEKKLKYPGKYITDATGEIKIPKDINFVKIKEIEIFAEKEFTNFKKNFFEYYKEDRGYELKNVYNENKITINRKKIYNINNVQLVNMTTRILSLLMLEWIQAIYYRLHPNYLKMVVIYPYKLIKKDNPVTTSTKIIFNNKEIKPDNNYINLSSIVAKDYDEYEYQKKYCLEGIESRKKEEKRIKDNTYILSRFENNNYYINVKREDNDVYLYFRTRDDKHYLNNYYLGRYNPNIKEEILYEGRTTIYKPKGAKGRIEVTNYEFKYNVKINDDFSRSYDYI